MNGTTRTVVLEVEGVSWASSKSIVESTLLRQPGVTDVEANPVSQTANVSYDPQLTSQAQLRQWIIDAIDMPAWLPPCPITSCMLRSAISWPP